MTKFLWLIPFGLALLVVESVVGTLVPIHFLAPNLILPIVIYLGVSHEVYIVRGSAIAFVLGFIYDSMTGNPMGLQTLMLVGTFVLTRFAGLRLFMRGILFQLGLTFVVAVLYSGAVLALRAIFEEPPPFPSHTTWETFLTSLPPALTTAAFSPLLFRIIRGFDTVPATHREDKAATP